MITRVEGNYYTSIRTEIGPSRFSSTLTLRGGPVWDYVPTTNTLTDSWPHGTYNFETNRKASGVGLSSSLSTMGPRRYV